VDEQIIYASDDRSSIELIEREFERSRARSFLRHSRDQFDRMDRMLRADQVLQAVAIMCVVVFMLLLLKLALTSV
jgi:hypothetical protein